MICTPSWPAPSNVHAVFTERGGGVSLAPWASLNLATHVGDDATSVEQNRALLSAQLGLRTRSRDAPQIQWLQQLHRCDVVELSKPGPILSADAAISSAINVACCVMTADCLPLLLCDRAGTQVAAVHAGWKGLAGGIVSNVVAKFNAPASELLVFLGPAISQPHFQVGVDVLAAFAAASRQRNYAEPIAASFLPDASSNEERYLADIYRLARSELNGLGVAEIYGGDRCTYSEQRCFFSYRRQKTSGRMASLIWLGS